MRRFVADFETCTWLDNETYVWAWAICEIGNENNIKLGNDIDSFIDFCIAQKSSICYFHNLKFDSEFIIYWALKHGFKHVTDKKDIKEKTFTTLIGEMGQFYNVTLYFSYGKKQWNKVTFYDSLKIIPFSVEVIAKSFNLPISKLTLDYNKRRYKGHKLTLEEQEYIKHDVLIVAKALKVLFDENLTKMTQGSNALNDFKKIFTWKKFKEYFPDLTVIDEDLRKSYKRRIYLFKSYL